MTVGSQKVAFHWGNYLKPTPSNLERIATLIRDTLTILAAGSYLDSRPVLGTGLAITNILVGQLVKFFASVAEDVRHEES